LIRVKTGPDEADVDRLKTYTETITRIKDSELTEGEVTRVKNLF